MTRSIPALVIGCGRMGVWGSEAVRRHSPPSWSPLSHADAIKAHASCTLGGVCDVVEQSARKAGAYLQVASFTDLASALDATAPELVAVATRTPGRAALICELLRRGVKAVHLEKPLCNSVGELEQVERAFAGVNVACTYGTLRRYMPIYEAARALAWSGTYGGVIEIHVRMGRAPLLWTHPHSLDLLLFFARDQQPLAVSARFVTHGLDVSDAELDGDPIVQYVQVDFGHGLTGIVTQQGLCDVEITCERGRIAVVSDGEALVVSGPAGDDPYWRELLRQAPEPLTLGGTWYAIDRLVRQLRQGGIVDAADRNAMFASQRLVFAACQSHLQGGAATAPADVDSALRVTGRSGDRFA